MRYRVSVILTIIFALSLSGGFIIDVSGEPSYSTATEFSGGDGTRNNPYLISTAGQLALFRDKVNNGEINICAKVINDIDLNNIVWEPIGMNKTGYNGIFDGGGWGIKNLYISDVSNTISVRDSKGNSYNLQVAGLFGIIGENGMVKYVDISGAVSGDISVANNTGVYIGSIAGTNFGVVEECYSTCSITGLSIANNNYIGIGGLVGASFGNAVIRNCFNVGAINATLNMTNMNLNNNYIGGIIGYADSKIYNCYSAAPIDITTNSNNFALGGVIGNAGGNFADNCHFDQEACDSARYVAGASISGLTPFNPVDSAPQNASYMKTIDFVLKLGNAFAYDYANVNNGYPILAVMTYSEEKEISGWADTELHEGDNMIIYERIFPADLYNKDLTKIITRAEFAAVAVKLYEEMGGAVLDAAELENPFEDTSSDMVVKAATIGLVKGVSPTEYRPYDPISRQDMCTMLTRVYKALNLPEWTLDRDELYELDYSDTVYFSDDAMISDYAKSSVYFLVKNNIIAGMTPTVFAPRSVSTAEQAAGYANASRQQAAILAVRMFKYLAQ